MNNKNKRVNETTLKVTRAAIIAALYTALTMLSSAFGLSSGTIQFRISEALCILPVIMPEAILGLTVGCLISNLIAGGVIWDIIFGSVATFIGAVGAYLLRKLPKKYIWLSTLPTVISNTLIVPFVIVYAYGASEALPLVMLFVMIGEVVCATLGGSVFYYSCEKLLRRL